MTFMVHRKNYLQFLLLAVLFVWSAGCAKDLITGKKSYNWFSLQEDVHLGQDVLDAQLRSFKDHGNKIDEAADPELTARIRKIVAKLGAASHNPSFPYEAHYAEEGEVNAWSAPGGKIMVYSGLIDGANGVVRKESDDEMAAVLAHEIAHATARHITEAMSRRYTIATLGNVDLTAVASPGSGSAEDLFSRATVDGVTLYIPIYSRDNEAQADHVGLLYMARAGYNPKAAVDVWNRACQKRGDAYSIYASHPPSCQRAKDLEKNLPEAQAEYQKSRK